MSEATTERFQTRVSLAGDDLAMFETLRGHLKGQSDTWIASTLLASALRSIQEQNFVFALPLKFKVQPVTPLKTGKK